VLPCVCRLTRDVEAQGTVADCIGKVVENRRITPPQQFRVTLQMGSNLGQRGEHLAADGVNLRAQFFGEVGRLVERPLLGRVPLVEMFALQPLGGLKLRDEKSGA
jgi:hypothetical protein